MKILCTVLLLLITTTKAFPATTTDWRITKPTWTEQDEVKFGEFVASIGNAIKAKKCRKVDTCIKSDANPYKSTDPADLNPVSDCADFPYYLRSYFAWKNGLPMSYESMLTAKPVPGNNKPDLRYTTYGNIVLARFDLTSTANIFDEEWLTSK